MDSFSIKIDVLSPSPLIHSAHRFNECCFGGGEFDFEVSCGGQVCQMDRRVVAVFHLRSLPRLSR